MYSEICTTMLEQLHIVAFFREVVFEYVQVKIYYIHCDITGWPFSMGWVGGIHIQGDSELEPTPV